MLGQCCCCAIEAQAGYERDEILPDGPAGKDKILQPLVASRTHFPNAHSESQNDLPMSRMAFSGPKSLSAALVERPVNSSFGVSLEPRDREQAKTRLNRLVRDFLRVTSSGILVQLIDHDTSERLTYVLTLDKYFYILTLREQAESSQGVLTYNMQDVTDIIKVDTGTDVQFTGAVGHVVRFETRHGDILYFSFADDSERDTFHTCLKVLRMSIDACTSGEEVVSAPATSADSSDKRGAVYNF